MILAPLLFLFLSMVLPVMATPVPIKAEGGIAMSGSFYTHSFEIPQGSSVSGPSIYVTVHNTSSEVLRVIMHSTVPDGVTLTLSHVGISLGQSADDFLLPAGEQRQLLVAVEVGPLVTPGDYSIMISAEGYRDTGEGLSIVGSAAEEASLTVVGEAALVIVDSIAPSGEPVTGTIRLFRVIGDNQYECASSTTGHLEARVSPGHYVAWAEMNGTKQGDELAFDLVANEEKSLTLTIEIIYFEAFAITPAYHPQTNELGYVQITYTVNNVYQQVDSAEVRLVITLNGALLEEIPGILSVAPLNVGRIGMPYEYTPAWGWEDGTYGFSLRLLINGEQYASTNEVTLDVDVPGGTSSLLFIILGIIGGGLLLGILVFAVTRRRKRGEKPEKAAKKKAKVKVDKKAKAKGEAPAPAAPSPGVEILFGREMPELKDAESAPGLAKTEAAAPPKEAARPAASTAAPAAPKPVVERPAAPKPSVATGPAGIAKETAPPSAPSPTPAPKPSQPPTGVKPAQAKPVQPTGAPKPSETAKPAPGMGAAKPVTPPAPPKAGETLVPKPAGQAVPQPPLARPVPPPEAPKPPQPAAPKVTEPPPATRPAAEPVRPAPLQPAAAKPPAERESARPPQGAPPGHVEKVAAPGAGVEADSLRQMPAEKAAGKPDLRVVSALEQRMSRVRKEGQPDSAKPAGKAQPGGEVKPAGTPELRPTSDKPVQGEAPVSATEPPAKEPAGESPVTGAPVPDKPQPADEETPAEPTSPEEGQKVEEADEAGEGDSGKTDKKFTSPIRFLNP